MKRSLLLAFMGMVLGSWLGHAAQAEFKPADYYAEKCAKCHGKEGKGDGRSAKKLNKVSTRFDDGKVFADKMGLDMTPEERMFKSIKLGGPSVKQSKEMDAYGDLKDDEVKALVEYLKTFAKK
ncbi:cytochrome c [Bdellovibrionota bacterium FG-1]